MNTFHNNGLRGRINVLFLFLCGCILFVYSGCSQVPHRGAMESCFRQLEEIKSAKKEQIINYFGNIKELVNDVANDEKMLRCFNVMREHYSPNGTKADADTLYLLEYETDVHYVNKYGDFYDILFVDACGFVFHSIKHEADYHTNLFTGQLSDTQLARHIRNNPNGEFVDYEFYPPSDEPAAFFIVPVQQQGKTLGWLVYQFPINKINTILSDHKNLGRTGEVYLVNRNKLMLTDSRFMEDSTILKLKVDTDAVKNALARSPDKMVINDYRGVRVFSAFEQFEVFGCAWVIIVEIDEDEVISNHYYNYKRHYLPKIKDYYAGVSLRPKVIQRGDKKPVGGKRVDMHEYSMARSGETLETKGVGPCTSLIVYYPNKFGYLAHISPIDEVYHNAFLDKCMNLLARRKTNFLHEMLKRIQYYDIYPYQRKDLQFVVIATHGDSLETIIDQLFEMEIHLAQIKFLFNPAAKYANVAFHQSDDSVSVEWLAGTGRNTVFCDYAANIDSIGSVMKKIDGSEFN